MARPFLIEGYAIVSADGMIADRFGVMPDALKIDADQRFFHGSLDRAGFLAHGRHSQEWDRRAAERYRIVLTRRVPAIEPHPVSPRAVFWNPAGASLEAAWKLLGAPARALAVIGGTDVFGLFLAIGYDVFYLSRASIVLLPRGGRVFPRVETRSPEGMLASAGLEPGPVRLLDAAPGAMVCPWRRAEERRTILSASADPRSST
jgi:dihydrofolate reductase